MRLGIDVSTYFEELEHGAKYFDGEREVSPLDEFLKNGVDMMRIRLWVDPKSEKGEKYLAGNCDLDNFLKLSRLAQSKGYKIMLDIHYSDFWCDPAKQMIPKSWQGLSFDELLKTVGEYTLSVLNKIKAEGIDLNYIQVGNEITNGMLWPAGRLTENPDGTRGNYENLISLIKAGCSSCRKVFPKAKIVLHLERSYDTPVYDEFFTHMQNGGVDFDTIGFSYYPYWHGTFEQFFANVEFCKKFKKELIVAEVGYAFTLEDYIKVEHGGAQLVVSKDNLSSFNFTEQYPVSPEGQAKFTNDFIELCEKHGVSAAYWWEPLWIPGDGICWASPAGQDYIGESGKPTRNEWANQCLCDYNGKKLPAFDKFKIDK
ncbi:MAG: arabinogalactan endo-1,4-beta-galactosidase [Clostridia bacterium]|nr:arabinogalactan endo-1,4-beta-galactosidase [Clostridia bacterium]